MLVNGKEIVDLAFEKGYAVGAFTVYNMEWINVVLAAAQNEKSPVIVSVSEMAADYMGGFQAVSAMVLGVMKSQTITVPVALHLDHGSLLAANKCLHCGFTSVMYDGSHESLENNIQNTAELVRCAHKFGISVEAEVGVISGIEEEKITKEGEIADPDDCARIADTGVDYLAASIGNVHGTYPEGWKGLNFVVLDEIAQRLEGMPLVLHGGTGIPADQITKAIAKGISKINVNTECQQAWASGLRSYFATEEVSKRKGYDPRKITEIARKQLYSVICGKMRLFGSSGQVKV